MARIISSTEVNELFLARESKDSRLHIYNAFDCCITVEVLSVLLPQLTPETYGIYKLERALQGPVVEMGLRGLRVSEAARQEHIRDLTLKKEKLEWILEQYAFAVWDKPLNVSSPKQLQDFFYTTMRIPPVITSKKGVKKVSTDREALEKIRNYYYARPIVEVILILKDVLKKLSVLRDGVDADGRMRTSYKISGTDTGRFASSSNVFGTGDNLQNWTDRLRNVFVADPGQKFAYCDLEQAESRAVAGLSGDPAYWDACHSGDLHTTVCKMVWQNLGWTGDEKKDKKEIAGQIFYRDFTYRDMAKRGGHGCLTEDHEVLTPDGWIPIGEKPKKILIYKCSGAADWEEPSHWEDKLWKGKLFELSGVSVSLNCTADHRIIFLRDANSRILHEEPAEKFSQRGFIPLGEFYIGGTIDEPLAKLVAAYQADGYQKSKNRVEFHFHKPRKFARIELLAREASIPFERKRDKIILHWHCPYPKEAGAYLLNWSTKSLQEYCLEHSFWDRSVGRTNSTTISSKSKKHLEWIQTCARLVGFGGNIQKVGSEIFRLQQNHRRFAAKASISISSKDFEGRVLCPTVSSGAFFIRRNGKISVTGNTNYYGTPFTMARHLKVETEVMEEFQRRYFAAFPGIRTWHTEVARELQITGVLTTPLGRRRCFFGRRYEDATLRKAIANNPQSLVGDTLNLGMLFTWLDEELYKAGLRIMAQLHDAQLVQYPEEKEQELLPKVLAHMRIPILVRGRVLTIPSECSVGWNWQKYVDEFDAAKKKIPTNLAGLREWTGEPDTRKRPEEAKFNLLDSIIR